MEKKLKLMFVHGFDSCHPSPPDPNWCSRPATEFAFVFAFWHFRILIASDCCFSAMPFASDFLRIYLCVFFPLPLPPFLFD